MPPRSYVRKDEMIQAIIGSPKYFWNLYPAYFYFVQTYLFFCASPN
ncbi:MAG: hypothetical protein Hyperionvirus5_36 [Hyperionvirus sp.]|uniref:Uncharacterized protein n=1 Tax=Hyperionvirus sp. TaxID=2487770 RepID=A0A3G5A7I1_9VIRU|nr:MAG: hypothetical protein Hyperionvirus5_36 [Hyperionvirus sp.]